MSKQELTKKYIEKFRSEAPIEPNDHPSKEVTVYQCELCGAKIYTEKINKGYTPLIIRCQAKHCLGMMIFSEALSNNCVMSENSNIIQWVRPALNDFLKLPFYKQMFVLRGGLILKSELLK